MVHIHMECYAALKMKFTSKCVELQKLYGVRIPKLRRNKTT